MKRAVRQSKNEKAEADQHRPNAFRLSVADSVGWPEPWCWVAEAWVDSDGRATDRQALGAVGIFAVSVHERFPIAEDQRLLLLQYVAQRLGNRVPPENDSLWVYPGGYFGFDALSAREGDAEPWPGFDARAVQSGLPTVLRSYPVGARLAIGADGDDQQVWVCWLEANGTLKLKTIVRHNCDLPQRSIVIGKTRAAFFVCGEFTGSCTDANGPYFEGQYLSDPAAELADCRILVDLAHSRVKGSVYRDPGPRLVHQRQLRRFAIQGTGVLTHHHPGWQTAGRARDNCQSNWVFFRGGNRLDDSQVHVLR